jgi:hypothetical protein
VPIGLKYASLNLLEISGPVQTCNGIALPLPLPLPFALLFDVSQGELKSGMTALELSFKPVASLK